MVVCKDWQPLTRDLCRLAQEASFISLFPSCIFSIPPLSNSFISHYHFYYTLRQIYYTHHYISHNIFTTSHKLTSLLPIS